jgi:glycosyltransferase involved in cell wall biosynthesis
MNSQRLVSCIVIFLNAERFIEEAIESIIQQTYDHWELLLVDDGSDDSSTEIARQYADRYPTKVRYLEHEAHQNLGMSASRNLGVRHAKGEFIAFLDADDIWLPAKIEEQVAILDRRPEAAMVYGHTLIWHSWTGKPEDLLRDDTLDLGVQPGTIVEPPRLFYLLLQNKVQTPTTCNFMIRRGVYDRLGGFVESFRGMYEDQAFFAKLFLKLPVFVADTCWAKYRQHPDSWSSTIESAGDYYQGRLILLTWIAQYMEKEGIYKQTKVWRALQNEIWLCRHPSLYRFSDFLKGISWGLRSRLRKGSRNSVHAV